MVWAILNEPIRLATEELSHSQSPRAVAVLGGAILEESLRRSMQQRLRADPDTVERLFRPEGPLGPFENKIKLGYVLYMYGDQERDALSGVARVRNLFAHELLASFDPGNKDMDKALARLTLHQKHKYYPSPLWDGDTEDEVETPKDNQDTFIINLRVLMCLLMRDTMKHRMWTNDPLPMMGPPVSL